MAWVYGGGIFICLCISFVIQFFLLIKKVSCYFAAFLFWLAFWTFISSVGYLIIGGLTPFGDVQDLIRLGFFTSQLSLALGLTMFFIGFFSLSRIIRKLFTKVFSSKIVHFGTVLFWLIVPILVLVTMINPARKFPLSLFPATFLPTFLAFLIEFYLAKQKTDQSPN